jgi:hypothetical protein
MGMACYGDKSNDEEPICTVLSASTPIRYWYTSTDSFFRAFSCLKFKRGNWNLEKSLESGGGVLPMVQDAILLWYIYIYLYPC